MTPFARYVPPVALAIAAVVGAFIAGRQSATPEPNCDRCYAKEAQGIGAAMVSMVPAPDGGIPSEQEVARRLDEMVDASNRKACVECLWERGNEMPIACERRCVILGSHLFRPTADGCICQDGQKSKWDWSWCLDEPIDCEELGLPPVSEFGLLDPRGKVASP